MPLVGPVDMPDGQRRSLGFFRPLVTPLTPINDNKGDASVPATLKKRNPSSLLSSTTSSPTSSSSAKNLERAGSGASGEGLKHPRPRSLQKKRPSSIFGSLRSINSLQDGDEALQRTNSTPISIRSTQSGASQTGAVDLAGAAVLHHGEIQPTGSMFRKKNQYLVLTETHLVRFKSQSRASEVFPTITASLGKNNSLRHSRTSSNGSLHDLYTLSEHWSAVQLNQIVAVHKLDDGRPYFSIEIAHLDEAKSRASAMAIQLNDPREADIWLSCIRATAEKARLIDPLPFGQRIIEYTARALEQERDYDPNHFHMFKVVQRASKSGARSSSDDLSKLTTNICILAIGLYKIHLVPLPKSTRNASSTSLADLIGASHGIMTLTSINVQSFDDKFELNFRVPLRQSSVLTLASSCVTDIALWTRQAADYLRPEWLEQPFTWNVPRSLDDELLPVSTLGEDHGCLDRTLTAYCAAYSLDTSKIRYLVDHHCEDAPAFQLLPPADPQRSKYSLLELLAVMRALRYNETFTSISFAHINLDVLHGKRDQQGWDHVPWTTRSGEQLSIPDQEKSWLLVQEVLALALKSKRLRRLDFSNCLTRQLQKEISREGCGICEALFPMCARQLTNVDWVILNGIHLADIDVDFLYAAAIEKSCHFRALELGGCGLMDRSMLTVLHAISHQGATMESVNLSGNPARIEPEILQDHIHTFGYVRRLNLSNLSRTSGPEPLLTAEIFLAWKLEEIDFSRTSLNQQTVAALSTYLKSPQSDTLRSLHLNQCQLTGADLANLLHAMAREFYTRELHLFVTENRLEQSHEKLVHAVSRSFTPSHMTIQMLEYSSEHYFGELMDGLAKNTSLRYLDVSKASLPKIASDGTSEALRSMFAKNQTLEVLDISGEEAHLEVANFGTGLNHALTGLKNNRTLKVLRIEHQKLGLQGASTLASVLEENRGLEEIHCDKNDINLQAFTVLVNSVERNPSLLYLPFMERDRVSSLRKVDREIDSLRESSPALSAKATVKKTLGAAIASRRSFSARHHNKSRASTAHTYSSDKEVQAIVESLSQQWERENARLQRYLRRNYNVAHGILSPSDALTAALGATGLDDITPRAEHDFQLGKELDAEKGLTTADDNDDAASEAGDSIGLELDVEKCRALNHDDDDDDDSASEAGDAMSFDRKDDIEGALIMSKSLRV